MPSQLADSDAYVHPDTVEINNYLIDSGVLLEIKRVEKPDLPWVEFVRHADGVEEHHYLMLNHGGLERA